VRPDDTLLHSAYLPAAEAAVRLARGEVAAAVEELRPASRYERGTVAALLPVYLRAEAQRRAGAGEDAIRGFRALVEHRGTDPFSPLVPLAQLGMARALAATRAHDESQTAYEELLRTWVSADADLPMLREAREEVSRLRSRADETAY
jgi:hypothetical protein